MKYAYFLLITFLLSGVLLAQGVPDLAVSELKVKDVEGAENLAKKLDHLPVVFRQNVGQWKNEILYRGSSLGWNANIYFMKDQLSFGFSREKESEKKSILENGAAHEEVYEYLVWNLKFINANANSIVKAEGKADSYTNYLYGNDFSKHKTNVPDYRQVVYENIYTNIDFRYYSTGTNLKYDYVLKPGAQIQQIQLGAMGIDKLNVNKAGQLEITTAWGTLVEELPESYQIIRGRKINIDIHYKLIDETTFSFETTEEYDHSQPLIIDPVTLLWATWLGGPPNAQDNGYVHDIARDAVGNIYGTGNYGSGWPTTPGAFDQTFGAGAGFGARDAFIFKLNSNGTSLIYSTYVGGSTQYINGSGEEIEVNSSGEAIVSGVTDAIDFPITVGAYNNINNGRSVFVLKLNSVGTNLLYSTFVGAGIVNGMVINTVGEVFIAGSTQSGSIVPYPVTLGAYQTLASASGDAFFSKLNTNGSSLLYSTYIGGNSFDSGNDIALNAKGEIFLVGSTSSTDFPTTAGAYDPTFNGPGYDGFMCKFNTTYSAFVYSTFIGGVGSDAFAALAINGKDEAFATGITTSANYPITIGTALKPFMDIVVTALNSSGSGLVYSTCIGGTCSGFGTNFEYGKGIVLNSVGEAIVLGESECSNFPVTCGAFQNAKGGNRDVVLFKLSPTGAYLYGTYWGGNSNDYFNFPTNSSGLISGSCEDLLTLGFTSHSTSGIPAATAGAYQTNKLNGSGDQIYVVQLQSTLTPNFTLPASAACGAAVSFTDVTCITLAPFKTWLWDFGDGTTSSLQNPTHVFAGPGTYNVTLTVSCPNASVTKSITITGACCALLLSVIKNNSNCFSTATGSATVNATGGTGNYTYSWSNGTTGQTAVNLVPGTYTVAVNDGGSCTNITSVIISSPSALSVASTFSSCSNGTASANVNGGSAYAYSWSTVPSQTASTATGLAAGTYTVKVTDTGNGCNTLVNVVVLANPFSAKAYTILASCSGNNDATAFVSAGGGDPVYSYAWSTSPVQSTPKAINLSPGKTYTVTVTDSKGCSVVVATTTDAVRKVDAVAALQAICKGDSVQLNSTIIGSLCSCGPRPSGCSGATQTAQVGDLTSTWNTPTPFNGTVTGLKQIHIISASELVASGLGCRSIITKIAFNIQSKASTQPFSNFTIKMKCGNATFTDADFVTVFNAKPISTILGWNTFVLDLPYEWDGANSLNVQICWSNLTTSGADVIYTSGTVGSYMTASGAGVNCSTLTSTGSGGGSGITTLFTFCAPPPTYSWSPPVTLNKPLTANPKSGAASTTTYTITVSGINNCILTDTVTVNVNNCGCAMSASTSIAANASCSGAGNGSAMVVISNGSGGPYTYIWSNGTSGITSNLVMVNSGLSASTYTVTISEGSCVSTATVTVTAPAPLVGQFTKGTANCAGCGCKEWLMVNATGGTSPYSYSWPDGYVNRYKNQLCAGAYSVNIKDKNGCSVNLNLSTP